MPPANPHEPAFTALAIGDAPLDYRGRAFLYVLAASGAEDLVKVGITQDPLSRWSSFHPRWFEAFDLSHSLLVETETRADAQRLETQLHRQLEAHSCPIPLSMRLQVGGFTEWYRGAYPQLWRFAQARGDEGYVVHFIARQWLARAMREGQAVLPGLLLQASADHFAGWLRPAQRQALQDLVDAHSFFDPSVADRLDAAQLQGIGLQ